MGCKCSYCGDQLILEKESDINNCIRYKRKNYHIDCFKKFCDENIRTKKTDRAKKNWKEAKENVDSLAQESLGFFRDKFYRDQVYKLIVKEYNMKVVSSNIFTRLEAVYQGQMQGMSKGICAEDLYNIWKKMLPTLRKTHIRREKKGIKFDTDEAMIAYDIAVCKNNYDNYCRWKKKKEIQSKTVDKAVKESKDIGSSIKNIGQTQKANEIKGGTNSIDIEDVLNDIF